MARRVAITLIRHGITKNNREKRYQGWADHSLLPEEKKRLGGSKQIFEKMDAVVSSDLKRCIETANLLFPYKRPILDKRLREMHFGDFDNKTYEQLKNCEPYRKWVEQAFQPAPPNGESFQTFTARIQEGWEDAIKQFNNEKINNLAIVTHAGVIRFFLEKYAPIQKTYWEWRVENGYGYRLIASTGQLRRGERCISFSEVPLMENPAG